jgi:hypothetical protein
MFYVICYRRTYVKKNGSPYKNHNRTKCEEPAVIGTTFVLTSEIRVFSTLVLPIKDEITRIKRVGSISWKRSAGFSVLWTHTFRGYITTGQSQREVMKTAEECCVLSIDLCPTGSSFYVVRNIPKRARHQSVQFQAGRKITVICCFAYGEISVITTHDTSNSNPDSV